MKSFYPNFSIFFKIFGHSYKLIGMAISLATMMALFELVGFAGFIPLIIGFDGTPVLGISDLSTLVWLAVIIFGIRSIGLSLCQWGLGYIFSRLKRNLSKIVLYQYLKSGYSDLKNVEESELQRNVVGEVVGAINFAQNTLLGLSELIIILCFSVLGITLLFSSFSQVSYIWLILLTFPIYILINKKLRNIGGYRQTMDLARISFISALHASVKFLYIENLMGEFFNRFALLTRKVAKIDWIANFLIPQPRIIIEFIAIIILGLAIIEVGADNISSLVVLLAVLLRILPALSRVGNFFSAAELSFASAKLISELVSSTPAKVAQNNSSDSLRKDLEATSGCIEINSDLVLNTSNLKVKRGDRIIKFPDVNLHMGDKYLITGHSGCGKTTFLEVLCGLVESETGKIYINEAEVNLYENKSWQKNIRMCEQSIGIFEGTIKENILVGREISQNRLDDVIGLVGLDEIINSLQLKIETAIKPGTRKLSGGQIQRLGLARGLIRDGSIIILDESFSSLDILSERQILNKIEDKYDNAMVLMVSHRPVENYPNFKVVKFG